MIPLLQKMKVVNDSVTTENQGNDLITHSKLIDSDLPLKRVQISLLTKETR